MFEKIFLQNVGETIIYQAFSNAWYVVSKDIQRPNTKRHRRGLEDVYYIEGSSLENTIAYFGLGLRADKLREVFWWEIEKNA